MTDLSTHPATAAERPIFPSAGRAAGAASPSSSDRSEDDVFALIGAHLEAAHRFDLACKGADEGAAQKEGRRITPSNQAEWKDALDAETCALDALMAATPVTKAEARALVAYLETFDGEMLDVFDVLAMFARYAAGSEVRS